MNNIEILEEKIKIIESLCTDDCINKSTVIQPLKYAIENLIQENKELKAKLQQYKKIEEIVNTITDDDIRNAIKNAEKDYIPKSKILNFINNELPDEEICECCSNFDVNGVRLKNELKKLLEEGE